MDYNYNFKPDLDPAHPSLEDRERITTGDKSKASLRALKDESAFKTLSHTMSKIASTPFNFVGNLIDSYSDTNYNQEQANKIKKVWDDDDTNVLQKSLKTAATFFNTPVTAARATKDSIFELTNANFKSQKAYLDIIHKHQSNVSLTSSPASMAHGFAEVLPYLAVDWPARSAKMVAAALSLGGKTAIKTVGKEMLLNSGKNLFSDVGVAYAIGEDTNKVGNMSDVLSAMAMSTLGTPLLAAPYVLKNKMNRLRHDVLLADGKWVGEEGKRKWVTTNQPEVDRMNRHKRKADEFFVRTGKRPKVPGEIKADKIGKEILDGAVGRLTGYTKAKEFGKMIFHDSAAIIGEFALNNKYFKTTSKFVDGEVHLPRYRDLQKNAKGQPLVNKYEDVTGDGSKTTNGKSMPTVANYDSANRAYGEARLSFMGTDSDMAIVYNQNPTKFYNNFKGYTKELESGFEDFTKTYAKYGDEQPNYKGGAIGRVDDHINEMKLDFYKDMKGRKDVNSNPKIRSYVNMKIAKFERRLAKAKPQVTKGAARDAYIKANSHMLNYPIGKSTLKQTKDDYVAWKNSPSKDKRDITTSPRYNKLSPSDQENSVTSSITARVIGPKIESDFINTVAYLEKKHKLAGLPGKFDPSNISDSLRKMEPANVSDVEDYIARQHDLRSFSSSKNPISLEELRFREVSRLHKKIETVGEGEALIKLYHDFKDLGLDDYIRSTKQKTHGDNAYVPNVDIPKHYNGVRSSLIAAAQRYISGKLVKRNTKGEFKLDKTITDSLNLLRQIGAPYKELARVVIEKTWPDATKVTKYAQQQGISFAQARKIISNENIQDFKNLIVNKTMENFGIPKKSSYISPEVEMRHHTKLDVRNSAGMNVTIATGSNELANKTMVKGTSKLEDAEVRHLITKHIQTNMKDIKLTNNDIKPLFMITLYGSMDKGLAIKAFESIVDTETGIKKLKSMDQARELVSHFKDALAKEAPEILAVRKEMSNVMENLTKPVQNYLIMGKKASIDVSKDITIKYKTKNKKDIELIVKTYDVDMYSAQLGPAIFQSIDAHIADELRLRLGVLTKHDAIFFRESEISSELVETTFRDIIKELNEVNVLDSIFKQLTDGKVGYNKASKLDDKYFDMDRQLLGIEHKQGDVLKVKHDNVNEGVGKELTPEEVMTRYLITESPFDLSTSNIGSKMTTIFHLTNELPKDSSIISTVFRNAYYGVRSHTGIKVPETNMDPHLFQATIRKLHRQFRANIEFNTSKKLDGRRIYFDEHGRSIGSHETPMKDVINKVQDNINKLKDDTHLKVELDLNKGLRDARRVQKDIADGKPVSDADAVKAGFIKSTQEYIPNKGDYSWKAVWKHISDKYNQSDSYKQYTKLLATKGNLNRAEAVGDNIQKHVSEILKGENKTDWTKHLVHTAYYNVSEFKSRAEAMSFAKQMYGKDGLNLGVNTALQEAIHKLGRGIGEDENKLGIALNNGADVCRAFGVPLEQARNIEKLASLSKMKSSNSWDFIEAKWKDNPRQMEEVLSMQKVLASNGAKHFENGLNDSNYIYGHVSEHYTENLVYKDGKYVADVEQKYKKGVLDIDRQDSRLGEYVTSDVPKFETVKQLEDYLVENRYRMKDGKIYHVADKQHRVRLGRDQDIDAVLGASFAANSKKDSQLMQAAKILENNDEFNLLFSTEAKDGFRKLQDKELSQLPPSLQDKVQYINSDYFDKLVGRLEHSFSSKDSNRLLQASERIFEDFNGLFKQNVVLKNISSIKNSLMSSLIIPMAAGANAKDVIKGAYGTSKEFVAYHKLLSKLDVAYATGNVKRINRYQKEIDKLDITQYIKHGLQVNSLDGVRVSSTVLNQILSDAVGNKTVNKVVNTAMLNQGTKGGEFVKQLFSGTDVIGRVAMVKKFIKEGDSVEDAVRKANDTFGNMDDMAPALIDAIDKKGLVHFAGWASNVIPFAARLAKDNPRTTIAATLAVLYASDALDLNFDSINPTGGYIDYMASAITSNTLFEALRGNLNLTPYAIPSYATSVFKQANFAVNGEYWQTRPSLIFGDRVSAYTTSAGDLIDHTTATASIYDAIVK